MDWSTRRVLSWRLSNTMDVEFCIEALEEALSRFGRPETFNSDQGRHFTSPRFTEVLNDADIRILMETTGLLPCRQTVPETAWQVGISGIEPGKGIYGQDR